MNERIENKWKTKPTTKRGIKYHTKRWKHEGKLFVFILMDFKKIYQKNMNEDEEYIQIEKKIINIS